MGFKEIDPKELDFNPFTAILNDWTLIAAGNFEKANAMTASWGMVGALWNEYAVTVYVRPNRYTKSFMDKEKNFTLSLFDGHKKELSYLGKVSGRDSDKIKDVGFHFEFFDGVPGIAEAKLVFVLEKMYCGVIKGENFLNADLEKYYPEKDYHYVYIGKITKVFSKA